MNARTTSALLAWLALGGAAALGASPHPAVCRIAVAEHGGQAFGSGTLVDARDQFGLVVTNWHVVRDATGPIEVRFPSGFTSQARPLKLDETWDLAALVVWRPPAEPAPLAQQPPQPGDTLTICGYGQGDYRSVTGRCTDYYAPEIGQPQELVELNVEARQGDSGGPIFNERGELAGVLFGAARGTTLGSFGGRVQRFLASLAPDIGPGRPTLVAESTRTPAAVVDPFLVAERDTGTPRGLTPPALDDRAPQLEARRGTEWPGPALSDRSGAPKLAVARSNASPAAAPAEPIARRHASGWRPATATAAEPFAPEVSEVISADQDAINAVDWRSDAQGLLAVIGLAALAAHALRAVA
ncbi:serine protease [Botrimarina sp.]|uniref:S1 family peptidase n=1 Tax=Botrimarina sp. TaxID=2795802 RepID=UPI0032EE8BAE